MWIAAVLCALIFACPSSVASGQGLTGNAVGPSDAAPLFRIFLKDGGSLASYGEPARVGDSLVFSIPTSSAANDPKLHLVELSSTRIDWDRTTSYAESARAARYLATRAELDYALFAGEMQRLLDAVPLISNRAERLDLIENTRKLMLEWPAAHYGYKQEDVRQMIEVLDEVIANLRASLGMQRFDLSLVTAASRPPPLEPMLPPPDAQDTIEQIVLAATVAESVVDRKALLETARIALDVEKDLPRAFVTKTRSKLAAALAHEQEVDWAYQLLNRRIMTAAAMRAMEGDVQGIERLRSLVQTQDEALNRARPDMVASMLALVEEQLDAARQVKLARERAARLVPALKKYQADMSSALRGLQSLKRALDDIKGMVHSTPDAIGAILRTVKRVRETAQTVVPPAEYQATHGLFLSAVQLAESAATLRREASLTGKIAQAWNASSAAAGALMLSARVSDEIRAVFQQSQFPQ